MELSYFPGCAGHSTARDQDLSTRKVLSALGITLTELKDWNCCGATPGHTISTSLSLALNLRNLCIASDTQNDLLVPCASCFGNLKRAEVSAKAGNVPADFEEVPSPSSSISVISIVHLLSQSSILERIKLLAHIDMSKLHLVAYYGCLLVRPFETTSAHDAENPMGIETVLSACGATVIEWPHKTDCCGGSHTIGHPEVVTKLTGRLIDRARRFGANAIVTACPMCHAGLDTVQWEARRNKSTNSVPLPVFYLTEIVGIALSLKMQQNWLKRHLIDPRPFLKKHGALK